jgi:lysophospholipase L1-like esterase
VPAAWDDFCVWLSARFVLAVVRLAAVGCLVAACSSSRTRLIVALGDSVPRGTNCDCRPYPPLTADDLATSTGRSATATNDAVAGATTASVLGQLNSDDAVINHVRTADAIEIEVGANDVAYSKSCATAVDCYAPELSSLEANLAAIVARARELASRHKLVVVLLDYWSVWLGGQYAVAQGPAYASAAKQMTDKVDSIVKATATETGSYYVDLRAAFKGPDYAYDETHFLSSDGDHSNAAGHAQIAKAVDAVLEKALG